MYKDEARYEVDNQKYDVIDNYKWVKPSCN